MNLHRVFALLAFTVSAWVIASLALSGDVTQSTLPITTGALATILIASAGDIVLTLTFVFVSVVFYWIVRDRKMLVAKLKSLLSRHRGRSDGRPRGDLKRDIIGIFMLVGILYALKVSGLFQSAKPANATGSGGSFPQSGGLDIPALQSSIIEIYRFFAVWAVQIALIAVGAVCILIFYQAVMQLRVPAATKLRFNTALATETIAALEEGAKTLLELDDYRKSILECYRRLCAIFDLRRENAHRPLTARELQSQMQREFDLPEKSISELTCLFEEARYSPHTLSTEMRDRAIEALQEIESSLRFASEKTADPIY